VVEGERSDEAEGGGRGPSAADDRDRAGERRDQAAQQRDQAAEQRDQAGDERDRTGDERDQAAEQRDQAAEQRDQAAERSEASVRAGIAIDVLERSALARSEAASDRRGAAQDRRAGASERNHSELDRDIALADRGAGASERTQAELDRHTALADRGASGRERQHASVDDLTGVYLRGAGLVELEREMARARRTRQPLVLAFVDVDRLKAIRDARGHAAGDRLLVEVANALRAELRSYDLIVRYGDDEFVCAISGLTSAGATTRVACINAALAETPGHGSITVGLAELQPDDSPEDLVARANDVLLRERQQHSGGAVVEVWKCGDLVVDEGTRSVTRAGSAIPLTATEFKVLGVLVRNRRRVVPKVQLIGEVWGYDADGHLLEVHMSSLRQKLEAHGPRMIQTVRGTGYVLRP
jgi:diguanylate cyclase (GGDEF)-like protein